MNALIQEIEQDLESGRTTLKFGAAGHLTLQDLMEQLRANRTRTTSSHIKERTSGDSGDVSSVDGGTQGSSDGGGQPPPPPPQPVDFQLQGGTKLSIYGGTVLDTTTGGVSWTPTGLTAGKYTDSGAGDSDTCAWLVISYTEDVPANITSVTFDTGSDVPASESGTFYIPLGTFTFAGGKFMVTSTPIGDQAFDAWVVWFTNNFQADCWPI